MKSAQVTPLYRKDNNLKRDDYVPVSILIMILGLYETVLNTQMADQFYVLCNELMAAFRNLYGCQTLLFKFILSQHLTKVMK